MSLSQKGGRGEGWGAVCRIHPYPLYTPLALLSTYISRVYIFVAISQVFSTVGYTICIHMYLYIYLLLLYSNTLLEMVCYHLSVYFTGNQSINHIYLISIR